MSWIKTIDYDDAEGPLKRIYKRVKGPDNNVDNVLKIHSLRPHTLVGHMALYKSVIHNKSNTLPKWYLETLGIYVSQLNHCNYCVEHHAAGLRRLLKNDDKYHSIYHCIVNDVAENYFDGRYLEGLQHAKKLTLTHHLINEADIDKMRNIGFSDGEILEVNQLVSYFNYVNRTVVGLGVNTKGDVLGLSPNDSDDPDNWSHG